MTAYEADFVIACARRTQSLHRAAAAEFWRFFAAWALVVFTSAVLALVLALWEAA